MKSQEAGRKCLPAMHTTTKKTLICLISTEMMLSHYGNSETSVRQHVTPTGIVSLKQWKGSIDKVFRKFQLLYIDDTKKKKKPLESRVVVLQGDKRTYQYC